MVKKNLILSQSYLMCFFALFSLLFITQSIADPLPQGAPDSLQRVIVAQDTIRIIAEDAPGFGNQTASFNIVHWLWEQKKYAGNIQFIYDDAPETKEKIITLFNLPTSIEDDYSTSISGHNIRFIKKTQFITLYKTQQIQRTVLAIDGGIDEDVCASRSDKDNNTFTAPTSLECQNAANFYNTELFVQISPYPVTADESEHRLSKVYLRDQDDAHLIKTINNSYTPVSIVDIADAKKLVENDPALLNKLPALSYFIDGIMNKDFNIMPIYGRGIIQNDDYGNILQIITAARYVQQNSQDDKPLILAIFNDYDKEIKIINNIINNNDWPVRITYPDENQEYLLTLATGQINATTAIQQLGLTNSNIFSIANLNQPETINLFKQIHEKKLSPSKKIILLSVGSLPKTIFDAIYTHTDDNVWPQVREGANSFYSLITTGKAHFRCSGVIESSGEKEWEIGYDLITDPELKKRLSAFYGAEDSYSLNSNQFCNGLITWKNRDHVYKEFGDLILDAANPNSSLSQYFHLLKTEASKPENDRIARALEFSLNLLNENNKAKMIQTKSTKNI